MAKQGLRRNRQALNFCSDDFLGLVVALVVALGEGFRSPARGWSTTFFAPRGGSEACRRALSNALIARYGLSSRGRICASCLVGAERRFPDVGADSPDIRLVAGTQVDAIHPMSLHCRRRARSDHPDPDVAPQPATVDPCRVQPTLSRQPTGTTKTRLRRREVRPRSAARPMKAA